MSLLTMGPHTRHFPSPSTDHTWTSRLLCGRPLGLVDGGDAPHISRRRTRARGRAPQVGRVSSSRRPLQTPPPVDGGLGVARNPPCSRALRTLVVTYHVITSTCMWVCITSYPGGRGRNTEEEGGAIYPPSSCRQTQRKLGRHRTCARRRGKLTEHGSSSAPPPRRWSPSSSRRSTRMAWSH